MEGVVRIRKQNIGEDGDGIARFGRVAGSVWACFASGNVAVSQGICYCIDWW